MSNYSCKPVGLLWEIYITTGESWDTKVERNGLISLKLAHAGQKSGKFGLIISQGGQQATDLLH